MAVVDHVELERTPETELSLLFSFPIGRQVDEVESEDLVGGPTHRQKAVLYLPLLLVRTFIYF